MRTVLKWVGRILGGLVGLVVVAGIVVFALATSKLNKTHDIAVAEVPIPTDAAAIERGEHLATSIAGCVGCHAEHGETDLAGGLFLDIPGFITLYGPNLTPGGVGAAYTDEDWVRAIRHGVAPDGTALIAMPSQHYYSMSDEDLGALIAYLKTVPPVDNQTPEPQLGPPAYIAAATSPDILPVQIIDHDAPRPSVPEPGPTVEYGEYLVTIGTCRDCHGEELNGDVLGPEDPPASNLTPGGELAGWSEEDYIQTIRTGVNPAGRELQEPMALVAEVMARATDEELAATFAYLQSLPARETDY